MKRNQLTIQLTICRLNQGGDKTSLTSADIETEEKDASTAEQDKTPEPTDDEYGEDKEADEKKTEEDDQKVSIATYLKFLIVMINSTLTSMTRYLNRFSRDYRYIRKVLTKEKKVLKARGSNEFGRKFFHEIELHISESLTLIYRRSRISGWECDWVSIKCGSRSL